MSLSRRTLLPALAVVWVRPLTAAELPTGSDLEAAMRSFAGSTAPKSGRVKLDIAPLVENGNVVPVSVSVESPMTAQDHVVAIALYNERNPQRDVAVFTLGPRAGKAEVSTRMRLATSQKVVAMARMSDGSVYAQTAEVIVTLAACIEGDT